MATEDTEGTETTGRTIKIATEDTETNDDDNLPRRTLRNAEDER